MNESRRALRNLDLNLLVILEAILEERSVTRASARVHLSQPAMSNALARLRTALGDPLFIKSGRTLAPTPRALELAPVVRKTLDALERALFLDAPFDPAKAEGTVRLGLSNFWHTALLPRLVEMLEAEAPGVSLEVAGVSFEVLKDDLTAGDVDAAIYLSPVIMKGVQSRAIAKDGYVCVLRKDHPLKRVLLEDYATCRKVAVLPLGLWAEAMSRALARAGLPPNFALTTTSLEVALEVVGRTDYLAVLPRRIANRAKRIWPVRTLEMPVDVGRFTLALYWHRRTEADPLQGWFRQRIAALASRIYFERGKSSSDGRRR